MRFDYVVWISKCYTALQKSDLKLLMMNYEEWANRMFPRMAFDDIIERTEKLGSKKGVKVCAEYC